MTTIVVNSPKRNHSLPFYFYPCKDASGNKYPIIEAGGLLWMASAYYLPQIIFFSNFFSLLQCFVVFLRIYE
jgi:hypothetical protein